MSAHTPGPWLAEPSHHEGGWNVVGPERKIVSGCCIQGGILTEDNARLIAAAPELLSVCQRVLDMIQQCGFGGSNTRSEKVFEKLLGELILKATAGREVTRA